jgi:DnaJ family protein C protein 7
LKRARALVVAKEAGNAAFKAGSWGEAHRQYSAALVHYDPAAGNRSFFAQCYSNRSG